MTKAIPFRSITLASALAVSSVAAGGCGLLVKAVKGELTPMGANQLTKSQVSGFAHVLATTEDASEAKTAFSALTSVYLYKCLANPSHAPKDGKGDIRMTAGEGLVAGMNARLAKFPADADPTADALGEHAASLQKQIAAKCGDKVGSHDAEGKLATAITMTTVAGRQAQADTYASALDTELEAAITGDKDHQAIRDWSTKTCPALLPRDSYCLPHVLTALHEKDRWDAIVNAFIAREAEPTLALLTESLGKEAVVAKVQTSLLEPDSSRLTNRGTMDTLATYLRDNDGWGGCDGHAASYKAAIASDDGVRAVWAIETATADKCVGLADVFVKALGNDDWSVRAKAVWAIGELDIRKGKKIVERLQWSDPGYSNGCYCYPVRDAARNAMTKLEVKAS